MFKIKILSASALITCALSETQYNQLKILQPEALVLKDDKGNEIFRIAYNPESGDVSPYGITFNAIKNDTLQFNFVLPNANSIDEIKTALTPILLKLKCLETKIKSGIENIGSDLENIESMLVFLD